MRNFFREVFSINTGKFIFERNKWHYDIWNLIVFLSFKNVISDKTSILYWYICYANHLTGSYITVLNGLSSFGKQQLRFYICYFLQRIVFKILTSIYDDKDLACLCKRLDNVSHKIRVVSFFNQQLSIKLNRNEYECIDYTPLPNGSWWNLCGISWGCLQDKFQNFIKQLF